LTEAAIRETKEEAGIDVELRGILGIEYDPREGNRGAGRGYVRMRVIFYAEPKDPDQLPKSFPDFESAGACWCSEEDLLGLKLRGHEVGSHIISRYFPLVPICLSAPIAHKEVGASRETRVLFEHSLAYFLL